MPRRGRSSPAPRPAAPSQSRGAHTATAPTGYAPSRAPAPSASVPAKSAESSQPGMIAQMAATAGSVAIGSTVGHALSSMLFGGGGGTDAQASSTQPRVEPPVQQQAHQQTGGISCEGQAKDFTNCLESADMNACRWYLDQLKACQAAAAPY